MKINNKNIKLSIRNFIGKYPSLFYTTYAVKKESASRFVNTKTDIVIEGFPRSANSFAVLALKLGQNQSISIAHHHHVPAQIIKAVSLKIPTIVLIREPKYAVVSFAIYESTISLIQALKFYISFYQNVIAYSKYYIVADFSEVISDYCKIIQKLNSKFRTNFKSINQYSLNMEEISTLLCQPEYGNELRVPYPSSTRKKKKKSFFKKLESSQYQKLLSQAESIYKHFLELKD